MIKIRLFIYWPNTGAIKILNMHMKNGCPWDGHTWSICSSIWTFRLFAATNGYL